MGFSITWCAVHVEGVERLLEQLGLSPTGNTEEFPESLISTLKTSQVDDLKKRNVIDKGMRPKVQSAIRALEEGVQRVHFIDGRLPHSLLLEIFTDKGIGTEIVHG